MLQYFNFVYLPVCRKMGDDSRILACFLCKEEISRDNGVNVTRSLENLVSVSKKRNDNHRKFLEKQSSVLMHQQCRRRYILKRNGSFLYKNFIPDVTKRFDHLNSPKRKRSRESPFDYKANCIFCALPASKEHDKKKSCLQRRLCLH